MTITVQLSDTIGALGEAQARRKNKSLDAYLQDLVREDASLVVPMLDEDPVYAVVARIRSEARRVPPLRMPVGNPGTLLVPSTSVNDNEDWREFQVALDGLDADMKYLERLDAAKTQDRCET